MDCIAEKILENNTVTDCAGQTYPLHSHTQKEQCELLQQIITTIRPQTSLEVGFAYGISTLFICEALQQVNAKKHIVLDPFQATVWKDIGNKNVQDAGYGDLVDFRPQFSWAILPQLVQEQVQIDFAYLDTSKVFDILLVDIFYITKLLRVGGVVTLDDCIFPGIRKLCRFMAKHPLYEVVTDWQYGKNWANESLENQFGKEQIEVDRQLGINANCVTFRKVVAEDHRDWKWFEDF